MADSDSLIKERDKAKKGIIELRNKIKNEMPFSDYWSYLSDNTQQSLLAEVDSFAETIISEIDKEYSKKIKGLSKK